MNISRSELADILSEMIEAADQAPDIDDLIGRTVNRILGSSGCPETASPSHQLRLNDLEAKWLLEAIRTHLQVAESGAYRPTDIEIETLESLAVELS